MTSHPVARIPQLLSSRSENSRFLFNLPIVLSPADARRDLVLMNVQTAAAPMHDVSHLHLLSPRAGGRMDKVILSRVLPETPAAAWKPTKSRLLNSGIGADYVR